MLHLIVWIFILSPTLQWPSNNFNKFPKNQREHFKSRDDLLQAEKEFENRNYDLSEGEVIVDNFLSFLKWKDMIAFGKDDFPPSKPIEKMLPRVQKTELYKYLRELPKGGNLHSHEDHQLSKKILFDIVWDSADFDNLYIVLNESSANYFTMDFFINPPTNDKWIKVKNSNLTKEGILEKNTLLGLMTEDASNNPTDASKRWTLINPLWGRASVQLISNIKIKKQYLWNMFEQSMSEGVTYLETRRSLGWEDPIYELDPSGGSQSTNGKKILDKDYEMEVAVAKEVAKNFSASHPRFIGHKRISYAVRFMDFDLFGKVMNTTAKLHKKYPDHVIGFDAVGEEDAGYSSLYYLDEYLRLYNDGVPTVPLYLHSVETSWPDDLLTGIFPGDLVSTLQNGYDNIILMAKRIGHGKGFNKKPFLKKIIKERKTAVEVCVVSNQILAMDADIRNHYGQNLFKEGIPIVLAPDDPGTFGYDNVTVDWYMVYLGWGTNLGDLKQFAINSLTYTGMSKNEKDDAIDKKWRPSWNEYITKMKTVACSYDFSTSESPIFYRAFPNEVEDKVKVHVFGRNFEVSICKIPRCKFGDLVVNAIYVSNQQLICPTPDCPTCDKVKLFIALDSDEFVDTKIELKYSVVKKFASADSCTQSVNIYVMDFLISLATYVYYF